MTDNELNKWWCHLTVAMKRNVLGGVPYPSCTADWNNLSHEAKEELYNINGGRDAHDHHKWKKGNSSLT